MSGRASYCRFLGRDMQVRSVGVFSIGHPKFHGGERAYVRIPVDRSGGEEGITPTIEWLRDELLGVASADLMIDDLACCHVVQPNLLERYADRYCRPEALASESSRYTIDEIRARIHGVVGFNPIQFMLALVGKFSLASAETLIIFDDEFFGVPPVEKDHVKIKCRDAVPEIVERIRNEHSHLDGSFISPLTWLRRLIPTRLSLLPVTFVMVMTLPNGQRREEWLKKGIDIVICPTTERPGALAERIKYRMAKLEQFGEMQSFTRFCFALISTLVIAPLIVELIKTRF